MRRKAVLSALALTIFLVCASPGWSDWDDYYLSHRGTSNSFRLDNEEDMAWWNGSVWVVNAGVPGPTDFVFIASSDAGIFWVPGGSGPYNLNPTIARSFNHMGYSQWHPATKHDYKTLLLGNRPHVPRGLQIDGWMEVEEFRLGYGFVAPQNPQSNMQGTDTNPYTSTVYIHVGAFQTFWREPAAEVKFGEIKNYNTVAGTVFPFYVFGGHVEVGDIHLNTSRVAFHMSALNAGEPAGRPAATNGGVLDITGRFFNITDGDFRLAFYADRTRQGVVKMDADDWQALIEKGDAVWYDQTALNTSNIDDYLSYSPIEGNRVIIGLASANAWYPQPAQGATGVDIFSALSWGLGQGAGAANVYLGTNASAVANADRLVGDISGDGPVNVDDLIVLADHWLTDPGCVHPSPDILRSNKVDLYDFAEVASDWLSTPFPEFKSAQSGTTFTPDGLAPNTLYYWRIEGVDPCTGAKTNAGTVWNFTSGSDQPPPAPGDPFPMNGENDAPIGTYLAWGASPTATSYKVHAGTTSPLPHVGTVTNVNDRIWRITGDLQHATRYYWRIDPVNAFGETPGTVWHFDTSPYRMKPGDFAIIPWSEPWGRGSWYNNSYENLRNMYKAGFNVAGFLSTGSNLWDLNNAEKAGMRGIIYDEAILMRKGITSNQTQTYSWALQQVDLVLGKIGNHPAVWHLFLADEPNLAASTQGGFLHILEHFLNAVKLRGHKGYVNLYPNYATTAQLGQSNYANYLTAFKTLGPNAVDYISYDHYFISGSTPGTAYWSNMADVMNAAKSIGKPFWFIGQAVKEGNNFVVPTEGTLRMQAYSAMAHGAKSIAWYQYFQWATYTEPTVTMTHAAVDASGNLNDGTLQNTWTFLKNVNLELHRVGETYVNWTHHNVYHGTTGNYLSGFSGSGSFVVGEFTDNQGRRCVLIANKSMTGSATVNSVTWHSGGSTQRVNPATGAVSSFGGVTLSAGQGVLLIRN